VIDRGIPRLQPRLILNIYSGSQSCVPIGDPLLPLVRRVAFTGMPPDQVVQGRAPIHQQLSFDDLAELDVLRASDEANADAVIRELLAVPSVT